MHRWGANLLVVVLAIHIAQVFIWGAYKRPRQWTWVSGCLLLLIVLGFGFTGYLLPWDLKAYFGTEVGTRIAGSAPGLGPYLLTLLRGGPQLGPLTLPRFYAIHVLLLARSARYRDRLASLASSELRHHPALGRVGEERDVPTAGPFFPYQAARDNRPCWWRSSCCSCSPSWRAEVSSARLWRPRPIPPIRVTSRGPTGISSGSSNCSASSRRVRPGAGHHGDPRPRRDPPRRVPVPGSEPGAVTASPPGGDGDRRVVRPRRRVADPGRRPRGPPRGASRRPGAATRPPPHRRPARPKRPPRDQAQLAEVGSGCSKDSNVAPAIP